MHSGDGDNMSVDKRTTRKPDYFGEKNPNAKLTEKKVRFIRRQYHNYKAKPAALARAFETSPSNISNIVARRTWKHI